MLENHDQARVRQTRAGCRRRGRPVHPARERGAFAVMTPSLILLMTAFGGFVMALSHMYHRKVELQSAADAIAIAAAVQLNGKDTGVSAALQAAAETAAMHFYAYNKNFVVWDNKAIHFSAKPSGAAWLDASSAQNAANAKDLFFVTVDTGLLDPAHSTVDTTLLRVLPLAPTSAHVSSKATAGRSSVTATPLAICAISDTPGAPRGEELLEYGFRRGVSYDLMALNPTESTSGAHFLVNPLAPPGTTGESLAQRMDIIQPFVCTGTLAFPALVGKNVTVEKGFPLASLYQQLNSRFGTYTSPCTSTTAPPDANVTPFPYSTAFQWLNVTPKAQSAESISSGNKLLTIADLPAPPAGTTADQYGPLWVYAKPAKHASYRTGSDEAPEGYATFTFNATDLAKLYTPGTPALKAGKFYPNTPYNANKTDPPDALKGIANRRVLNVPLLRCPVTSSAGPVSAEVLAVGKFFMTVPATASTLHAEFAGVAPQAVLGGQVDLYP